MAQKFKGCAVGVGDCEPIGVVVVEIEAEGTFHSRGLFGIEGVDLTDAL